MLLGSISELASDMSAAPTPIAHCPWNINLLMRREKITAATDADAYGHRRDRGLDPSNNVNVIPIAA